jgi:hypothetical protein
MPVSTKVWRSVASGGAGRWLRTTTGALGCGLPPPKPFEQIQGDLGISGKVLTERLNHLVECAVLERRPVLYRHHACGEISAVDLRCAHCGEPMHARDVDALAGPGSAA